MPVAELHQTVPERPGNGFGLGVDLELLIDVSEVKGNRIDTYPKLGRCRLVIVPLDKKLQQLSFGRREVVTRAIRWSEFSKQCDHPASDLGRHGSAA